MGDTVKAGTRNSSKHLPRRTDKSACGEVEAAFRRAFGMARFDFCHTKVCTGQSFALSQRVIGHTYLENEQLGLSKNRAECSINPFVIGRKSYHRTGYLGQRGDLQFDRDGYSKCILKNLRFEI